MTLPEIDYIKLTKEVVFVGDYFTLMTTVVLDEQLREEGEDDHDFATRLASVWLQEHYGWDVASVSNEIGVGIDDEEEEN
jgi:adenosyl cobinamide kinase/adenosyl cobinamide phosphate guanylyltransferase